MVLLRGPFPVPLTYGTLQCSASQTITPSYTHVMCFEKSVKASLRNSAHLKRM